MDLTERTIESKTMFQGRIITVLLDTAGLPDGGTAQREVVLHPGGVAVLALAEADQRGAGAAVPLSAPRSAAGAAPPASWTRGRTTAPPPFGS